MAPSTDRHNMLGSLYLRIACTKAKRVDVVARVKDAEKEFLKAANLEKNITPESQEDPTRGIQFSRPAWDVGQYAGFRWNLCRILVALIDKNENQEFKPQELETWCQRMTQIAAGRDKLEPSFWTAAWCGHMPFLTLLLQYNEILSLQVDLAKKTLEEEHRQELQSDLDKRMDKVKKLHSDTILAYHKAIARGCSPRNLISLKEQITVAIEILRRSERDTNDLCTMLNQICEQII
ncbi:MAG: hypothetical protein R3C05_21050 [Pirellulaceae bacterium]